MHKYQELMVEHQTLQKRLADQPDTVEIERVRRLIAQARDAGANIGDPQQREQLHAILRYWGAYIYENTGELPPTQLAPYEPRGVVSQAMVWLGLRESQWGLLRLLPWGLLGLLALAVAWVLIVTLPKCRYRPVAPDVTATPTAGVEVAPSEQDQMATAAAESTRMAEMAEATPTPAEVAEVAPSEQDQRATAAAESTRTAEMAEATPTPTATPVPPTPAFTPLPPGQVTHVVHRGDTLFRIALRYGTTVQAIASANGIANPARIYVGQKLVISTSGGQPPQPPAGATTYVVQPGDNLFRIALRYNLSYMYLAQYNGIANPSCVYAGQVLRIPPY
jgi:LysM repeat protein